MSSELGFEEPRIDMHDVYLMLGVILGLAGLLYLKRHEKSAPVKVESKGSTVSSGSAQVAETTRKGKLSFVHKLGTIKSTRKAVLFYGSQSGTGEDFCQRFATDMNTSLGIPTLVCNVDTWDMTELPLLDSKCLVGFFIATYGEGEPTDSSLSFFNYLMGGPKAPDEPVDGEGDDKGCMKNLSYVMFGLGNRTYEFFNAMSIMIDQRLRLWGGATRLGELGLGDDMGSIEDDYEMWSKRILEEVVCPFYGLDSNSTDTQTIDQGPSLPLFNIEWKDKDSCRVLFQGELTEKGTVREWRGGEEYSVLGKPFRYDPKFSYYANITDARHLFAEQSVDSFFALPSPPEILNRNPPQSCVAKLASSGGEHSVQVKRECLHVEVDIEPSNLRYETGDHLGIFPYNTDEAVLELVDTLQLSPELVNSPFRMMANNEHPMAFNAKFSIPTPCTLWIALKYYLDIGRVIKQYHLAIMKHYASNEETRQLLFTLAKDKALYSRYVGEPRKNLAQVLEDLGPDNIQLPIQVVLGELLHVIPVRYYSISSSSRHSPRRVSITVGVVRYAVKSPKLSPAILNVPHTADTGEKRVFVKQGLTTGMLSELLAQMKGVAGTNGSTRARLEKYGVQSQMDHISGTGRSPFSLPVIVRRSKFKLPRKSTAPIVMVGPGTGFAPFRGFVYDRIAAIEKRLAIGKTVVFFGARHESSEFIYADEWKHYGINISDKLELESDCKDFKKLAIVTAFSRDASQKFYVQHRLSQSAKTVWQLLNDERGYFFVCGDATHMAVDVQNTLIDIARVEGQMAGPQAEAWVKKLRQSGRYLEDVWT